MKPALAATTLMLALLPALVIAGGLFAYTPDRSRPVLESRYGVGPQDYREVAGIRLRLRDEGPPGAAAIILLHGFGSSLDTWDPWAAALSRNFRVIRFDLPGFGLTGPDPTGDYSDRRAIAILLALMDGLGLKRASLIGNSLGGKIAWGFAAHYPARVDRLVLISPDGFASPGFDYGRTPRLPPLLRLLPYSAPKFLLRMTLQPAYADPERLTAATVTRYHDMMLAPGNRQAMLARMRQVMLENPLPLLRRIQAPTLILWGEQDHMIPFTNAADYVGSIGNARLAALPGLGHVPFEEDPDVALVPVSRFLANQAS